MVGYARRDFLVPVPVVAGSAALNAQLERRRLERLDHRLRGHAEGIGERLERDPAAALQPRPPVPYDARERRATRVSTLSLVRHDRTDHSVPTAYGHRPVLVKGSVDEVVIACGAEVTARHPRSWAREAFFDPRHDLALLERKIGALGQAAPLQGWDLPDEFATLRRLLEARPGKAGERKYVQVLRLLEAFRLDDVCGAVREALRLGALGDDAVEHPVLSRLEHRPPRLDPTADPHLPRATVATTSAEAYLASLGGAAP